METMQSPRGYGAESYLQGNIPRTPPYTPRPNKRRVDHNESPASVASIQPTETVSPAKRAGKRSAEDEVTVEELAEGDAGYTTDMDVVYPHELEEVETESDVDESDSDNGDESDTGITEHFERLGCGDGEEAEFVRQRRQKHVKKRTGSKVFKRSHSQSAEGEMEITDPDAMADHDITSSARRLRRRVRGPTGVKVVFDEPKSSPEPQQLASPAELRERRDYRRSYTTNATSPSDGDAMDVDDSD